MQLFVCLNFPKERYEQVVRYGAIMIVARSPMQAVSLLVADLKSKGIGPFPNNWKPKWRMLPMDHPGIYWAKEPVPEGEIMEGGDDVG